MTAFRRLKLSCLLLSGPLGIWGLEPALAFDVHANAAATAAVQPTQPAAAVPHTPRPRAGGQASAAAAPGPCGSTNRAGAVARPRVTPISAGCDDAGGLTAGHTGAAVPEGTALVDATLPVE